MCNHSIVQIFSNKLPTFIFPYQLPLTSESQVLDAQKSSIETIGFGFPPRHFIFSFPKYMNNSKFWFHFVLIPISFPLRRVILLQHFIFLRFPVPLGLCSFILTIIYKSLFWISLLIPHWQPTPRSFIVAQCLSNTYFVTRPQPWKSCWLSKPWDLKV